MTDKNLVNLTNEDIISSLEVIATTRNCNECKIRNCKWGTCNCEQIAANAALELINRQKSENLELRLKVNELLAYKQEVTKNNMKNYETYKSQKAEIERLQKEVNLVSIQFQDLQEETNEIKSEAYKEFADRLKLHSYIMSDESQTGIINRYSVVTVNQIDNILKEMVGEEIL